jgi:hypothetical protein
MKNGGGFGGKKNGSAYVDVLLTFFFLLILVVPLFSYVAERYVLLNKLQIMSDAIDASSLSAYMAINTEAASSRELSIDPTVFNNLFRNALQTNLSLNADMSPRDGSMAVGTVILQSSEIYMSGFPMQCPKGSTIRMKSFHIVVGIPVEPGFIRTYILNKDDPAIVWIHRDCEMPVI